MRNYKQEYYEQSCLWEADSLLNPGDSERIEETVRAIPNDISTVLDVGCGNGTFINALLSKYPSRFQMVVGTDFSSQALRHVAAPKTYNSVANLSFKDESFDLVTCLEVLEHLGQEDYESVISEIQRVSKKYILITVPNDENLEKELVLCPKCSCAFSPFFHVRRFDKATVANLFNHFKNRDIKEVGPLDRTIFYKDLFYFLRLGYLKPYPPQSAICPQCGYRKEWESRKGEQVHGISVNNHTKLLASFMKLVAGKSIQKKRWLLALFIRC